MGNLANRQIGILPAGALGVAFAAHLSNGFEDTEELAFLPRSESQHDDIHSTILLIENDSFVEQVANPPRRLPPLPELADDPPAIILAGPMPDQLFSVVRDLVSWLNNSVSSHGLESAVGRCPVLIMTSNGIYFQRLRSYYLEVLEEAVMLGTLPDLWPDQMPLLVGKFLRGVTIQTGLRTGKGDSAIYRPGPSGLTTLAGGSSAIRHECCNLLSSRGMRIETSDTLNPTRIEFDKATVNLAGNLFGQILSIDAEGNFKRITIGETHATLPHGKIDRLIDTLVAIGKAVRAYPENYTNEQSHAFLIKATEEHKDHVASSVQLLESLFKTKQLNHKLPPTEAWLLEPLINYARARELHQEEQFLLDLKCELLSALSRAAGKQ